MIGILKGKGNQTRVNIKIEFVVENNQKYEGRTFFLWYKLFLCKINEIK